MIKLENCEVLGWEHTIRGMRNPMNSWVKIDSAYCTDRTDCRDCPMNDHNGHCLTADINTAYVIGPNDHELMMNLAKGGPVHAKYRRMIAVYVDITAPLYWWKEFDTYKVGTVSNSCSTMHKIHAKEFELADFSTEHLFDEDSLGVQVYSLDTFRQIIESLNIARDAFVATNDKRYWHQMIQLLPSSYNQKRTVMLNYEVLAGIYPMWKNHKLDEWREFCKWIEKLPYSELITTQKEVEYNPLEHPERYLDDTMTIVDDMTMAQRRELLKYLEDKIEGNKMAINAEKWVNEGKFDRTYDVSPEELRKAMDIANKKPDFTNHTGDDYEQ